MEISCVVEIKWGMGHGPEIGGDGGSCGNPVAVDKSAGADAVETSGDGWIDAEALFDDCEEVREGLSAVCIDEVGGWESCSDLLGEALEGGRGFEEVVCYAC